MKRKLILVSVALLTVVTVGLGIQTNVNVSNDLLNANVEALSSGGESSGVVQCPGGWTQCATNGTTTLYMK